jgi:hypothetical protein
MKLGPKQKMIIQLANKDGYFIRKQVMEKLEKFYYCNAEHHIQQVLGGMVRAGLIIRTSPGVYVITKTAKAAITAPNQITLFDGTDTAIKAAGDAQERRYQGWTQQAMDLLRVFVKENVTFMAEDFRLWAEANGLAQPAEPRAYGMVIKLAVKDGLIKHTGHWGKTKVGIETASGNKSHRSIKTIWTGN